MQLHFVVALLLSFIAIATAIPHASNDGLLAANVMERDAPHKGWKRNVDGPKGTWKIKRDAVAQEPGLTGASVFKLVKKDALPIDTGADGLQSKKLVKKYPTPECDALLFVH